MVTASVPQVDKIFNAIDPQQLAAAAAAAGDDDEQLAQELTAEQFAALKRDVEQLGGLQYSRLLHGGRVAGLAFAAVSQAGVVTSISTPRQLRALGVDSCHLCALT